jgi:hypothetical protein
MCRAAKLVLLYIRNHIAGSHGIAYLDGRPSWLANVRVQRNIHA